jgi:hypothetical protein
MFGTINSSIVTLSCTPGTQIVIMLVSLNKHLLIIHLVIDCSLIGPIRSDMRRTAYSDIMVVKAAELFFSYLFLLVT